MSYEGDKTLQVTIKKQTKKIIDVTKAVQESQQKKKNLRNRHRALGHLTTVT